MFTWKPNKNSWPLTSRAHKHGPRPRSPSTGPCFPWDRHRIASACLPNTNRKTPACSIFPACGNPSLPGRVRTGALWFPWWERERCHKCPLLPDKDWALGRRQHPLPAIPAESCPQVKGNGGSHLLGEECEICKERAGGAVVHPHLCALWEGKQT